MARLISRLSFLVSFILLMFILYLTMKDKRSLQKEKETLILRNDSLHIIQLEKKKEIQVFQKKLDSLENKKSI
jgi:hypothetical protein